MLFLFVPHPNKLLTKQEKLEIEEKKKSSRLVEYD